jgi:hypothetical protein
LMRAAAAIRLTQAERQLGVGLRVAFALSRCSRTCIRLAMGISVKAVAHLLKRGLQ